MTGPLQARDVDAPVRPVRQAPGGSDGGPEGEEAGLWPRLWPGWDAGTESWLRLGVG